MQKLTKFKVIFDLFTVCVYIIQQQNCKLYYIYLMIISEIQSEIGHCSYDSAKFKAPADFSHHAILCMTLSLRTTYDFTTAGDWDCVAVVERLPALHYSVDFIFLSFGIMGFIVEL